MDDSSAPVEKKPPLYSRVWGAIILVLSPVFPFLYLAAAMGVGDSGLFEDLPTAVTVLQFLPNLLMFGGLLLSPAIFLLGFAALVLGDRASPIILPTLVASASIHIFTIIWAMIPLFFQSGVSAEDLLRIRKFMIDVLMPSLFCASVFLISSYIAWSHAKRQSDASKTACTNKNEPGTQVP